MKIFRKVALSLVCVILALVVVATGDSITYQNGGVNQENSLTIL